MKLSVYQNRQVAMCKQRFIGWANLLILYENASIYCIQYWIAYNLDIVVARCSYIL